MSFKNIVAFGVIDTLKGSCKLRSTSKVSVEQPLASRANTSKSKSLIGDTKNGLDLIVSFQYMSTLPVPPVVLTKKLAVLFIQIVVSFIGSIKISSANKITTSAESRQLFKSF